jgi:hypothetical protein
MARGTPNRYSPPSKPVRVAPASRQIGNSRWPNLKLTSLGSCVASSSRTHASTVRGVNNDRWKWTRRSGIRTALAAAPFLLGATPNARVASVRFVIISRELRNRGCPNGVRRRRNGTAVRGRGQTRRLSLSRVRRGVVSSPSRLLGSSQRASHFSRWRLVFPLTEATLRVC